MGPIKLGVQYERPRLVFTPLLGIEWASRHDRVTNLSEERVEFGYMQKTMGVGGFIHHEVSKEHPELVGEHLARGVRTADL